MAVVLVGGFSLLVVFAYFVGCAVGRCRADREARADAVLLLDDLDQHIEMCPTCGRGACWLLYEKCAARLRDRAGVNG